MKNILLVLSLFFAFLTNSNANINEAGFTGSESSITFDTSFLSLGTPSSQASYLKAVSGIYSCPKPKQGQTMILNSLEPKSGKITCYLYGTDSSDPIDIYKQTGDSDNKVFRESSAIANAISSGAYKSLSISKRFGNYEFTVNNTFTGHYIQTFDLGSLQEKSDKIKAFLKSTSENDSSAFSSSKISLDSHTSSEKTLSNILTGLITLNPDYFEADNLVNANGTVALKDYALFGNGNTTNQQAGDTNIIGKIFRFAIGNSNIEKKENLQVMTLVGFLDKKFWGFYTYLLYNLKEAYISILGSMMLFGGSYALGRFGYRRTKGKVNKDDETVDKGKLASKSMDVFLVMGMFLVPISINKATIPDNFLYTKSNISINTTPTTPDGEELFAQSTLSSGTIRYFAELGSTWANTVNDYALFSYLRYLESKQKAITANGLTENDDAIKKLYTNTIYLKKDYDFYINVCRPAFSSILSQSTRFNAISKDSRESFLNNTISLEGTPIHQELGYSKINPVLCLNLEEQVATSTKKILSDYARIQSELEVSLAIIDGYNSKAGKAFDNYVDFMQFVSNHYGWISSAVIPPSYSILFEGKESIFTYDVAQKKIQNSDGNNVGEAWAGNDVEKNEISDDLDSGAMAILASHTYANFTWFVLPGFSDVFSSIHNFMKTSAGLDPAQLAAKKTSTSVIEGIKTVLNIAPGVGQVASKLMTILNWAGKYLATPLLLLLAMGVSLMIATFLYTTMISTITMVVIGGAIAIKICIYFMELLLYYFLTDAILFISIVTQKNEYFVKFLSKGMTITLLTPLLVVLSVYVYIFFHTLAVELYSVLISTIYSISMVQDETIAAYSEQGFITGILKEMSMYSMQKFGEIIITLFSLVIGVVTIFKFKDWVFKIIGVEDSDFSSSISEGFNQKITGGINPVK